MLRGRGSRTECDPSVQKSWIYMRLQHVCNRYVLAIRQLTLETMIIISKPENLVYYFFITIALRNFHEGRLPVQIMRQ